MTDDCKLDALNGIISHCREEHCQFWRVVEHVEPGHPGDGKAVPHTGCAIQYFSLLDGGSEIAQWLLTVRERLDGERPS